MSPGDYFGDVDPQAQMRQDIIDRAKLKAARVAPRPGIQSQPRVIAYVQTSGSRPAGWGAVIVLPDKSRVEMCGGDPEGTSNSAALAAFTHILRSGIVPAGAVLVAEGPQRQYVHQCMLAAKQRRLKPDQPNLTNIRALVAAGGCAMLTCMSAPVAQSMRSAANRLAARGRLNAEATRRVEAEGL